MSGKVAEVGARVRGGSAQIARALTPRDVARIRHAFTPLDPWLRVPIDLPEAHHAAWLAVGCSLTNYIENGFDNGENVGDALARFDPTLKDIAVDVDVRSLVGDAPAIEIEALLPYLLDPLAPGTRRAILSSSAEVQDRKARKESGIFYTPADLAEFMVNSARSGAGTSLSVTFDPAVGSGVFLRAAAAHGAGRLMGIDVSPIAADLAAFVLMTASTHKDLKPFARWHLSRLDLATENTLLLKSTGMGHAPDEGLVDARLKYRTGLREALLHKLSTAGNPRPPEHAARDHLSHLLPELASGADLVLSNPPYASIPPEILRTLPTGYAAVPPDTKGSLNLYPLFVEYAVRATDPQNGRVSVVTPLSLAFGQSQSLKRLRGWISEFWAGEVDFAHFDRTPDALFGDDVKTRNTVLTLRRGPNSLVRTTSLLRWTSRTRRSLFETISYERADADIREAVPKFGSPEEARLHQALRSHCTCLETWLADRKEVASRTLHPSTIFVAPTAYNWLNCLPDLRELEKHGHDASTKFNELLLPDSRLQMATYAIASSRLTHFLWRTEGDGFHVTQRFLRSLPCPESASHATDLLAELGEQIWFTSRKSPIRSLNANRTSIGFPATPGALLDAAERILLGEIGFQPNFDLSEWHKMLTVVDQEDHQRNRRNRQRNHQDA